VGGPMITIDFKAEAGYAKFTDKKIDRTVVLHEIMEMIHIDVAADGTIVGLEFIGDVEKLPKEVLDAAKKI
jgi:uncharacterized protein YuzE